MWAGGGSLGALGVLGACGRIYKGFWRFLGGYKEGFKVFLERRKEIGKFWGFWGEGGNGGALGEVGIGGAWGEKRDWGVEDYLEGKEFWKGFGEEHSS